MPKLIYPILLLLILSSCHAITGSGTIITETMHPGEFTGIKSSGSIDIEVKNGSTEQVEIEADDNVMKYIVTDIQNGVLDVRYKSHLSLMNSHVKVFVTAPEINKLVVSGSADIISHDTLQVSNKLESNIDGSGGIKVFVNAPSVTSIVDGSGTIELKGRTRNFNASISGSGDIKCHNLLSENTTVVIDGSGAAHVYASISLSATVSGSGDVYYSGHPASPTIIKSGSGSVQQE